MHARSSNGLVRSSFIASNYLSGERIANEYIPDESLNHTCYQFGALDKAHNLK